MPDLATFNDIGPYLRLGVPGALMVFVEFVVFEVLALYAGLMGIAELSAMGLLLNWATLVFSVPYGLHLTVCVFIGNSLGEGDHKTAIR